MATTKVVLYKSKTLKNGEHPIMLRVIQYRRAKYVSTGFSCSLELWDEKNNRPKKAHPLWKEMEAMIRQKEAAASKLMIQLDLDEIEASSEDIINRLRKVKSRKTLFEYFDETIHSLEQAGRIGYANVFKETKRAVSKFRKGRDMAFSDLTHHFLVSFDDDFTMRGVKLNSVFVFMRTLKTLVNKAKKESVVRSTFDPFKDFSFKKYRRVKTRKRAIDKEDIKKIAALELSPEETIYDSRNFFLFSYYCMGINFIDIAYLKKENIENGRLLYTRRKTGDMFSINLLPPALDILAHYENDYPPNPAGYLFPILNERHETPKSQDYRIEKIMKRTNKELKTIGTMIGIDTPLTTYVARHTFATVMKKSGIQTSVISEAMGHESERTTRIYLASFGDDVLDQAAQTLL